MNKLGLRLWANAWKVSGVLLLMGLSLPGLAQMEPEVIRPEAGDRIRPYVWTSIIHDDNLFRLADDEPVPVAGTTDKSDNIYSVGAGVNVNLEISRQRVRLDGNVTRNYYDRFDFLDYTGADGRLLWRWQYGRLWSGDVGYVYERTLRGFTESQLAIRDIRAAQRAFASALRQLTPRWRMRVGADWASAKFDERDQQNRRRATGELGVQYVSRAENVIGLQGRYSDAEFPDRPANLVDTAYTETEIDAVGNWRFGGRSRVQFRAGFVDREHDATEERDFKGLIGRADYFYQLTGKTSIRASAWRELSSLADEIANYAVVKGIGIEPTWNATSKIALRLAALFEKRDFRGGQDPVDLAEGIVTTDREDDVFAFEISAAYSPRRNIHLTVGYRDEDRDSTREDVEYQYDRVMGVLQVDF